MDRCFVRVRWDSAASASGVHRAVGGFLRYIQHRDLHPDSESSGRRTEVAGLLKYVAYRDQANARAELFCPEGRAGTPERKAFAEHVARSIEHSRPQLYRSRGGALIDRRRVVSRFVMSPERASGLDLERLTRSAIAGLESEMGFGGLRWLAAIHRNTKHHHIHLVLAGMHEDAQGGFHRVDISKRRLDVIKQAIALEIERQRSEQILERRGRAQLSPVAGGELVTSPALKLPAARPAFIRTPPATGAMLHRLTGTQRARGVRDTAVLRLRAAARAYQRRMQRETEDEARRLAWGRAA